MPLIVSQQGGFCFGVKRAVDLVEQALREQLHPIYTLGVIIHNQDVVNDLRLRGAIPIDDIDKAPDGATLIIRAHGVAKNIFLRAEEKNIQLLDATCPYVERIQKKVEEYSKQGYQIIVVGKAEHPEVQGICGWSTTPVIVLANETEAETIFCVPKAVVLAQTTIQEELFESVCKKLKKNIPKIKIENTICSATANRQKEALEIAEQADSVIVIGGKKSSNTQELYRICKKKCKKVYIIENNRETILEKFSADDIIGIITGASTPNWIMMEVVTRMSENEKTILDQTAEAAEAAEAARLSAEEAANNEFMEAFEKTLVRIRNGQILTGTIVQITDNEVSVNIGYKSDGFIPRSEFSDNPEERLKDIVKEGDEIEVEVVKVNDGDGNVLLSHKSVMARKAWDEFMEKAEVEGTIFDAVGKEVVKGGLITYIEGVRTFIPASQLSLRYVENLNDFVGEPLRLEILEVDRHKRRVVASQKKVLQQEANEKKKEVWQTLHEGDKLNGIVRRLTDFGAFVDIGGIDGLVHVTEMAWGRVKHPSDIFKINDEIEVVIKSLDSEKERISLGYRELQPKPWASAAERYPINSVVEGRVVRLVPFGAFVSLEPTIDGLIHISQLDTQRIEKVEDVVKEGDILRVKVLAVDPEAKRISLSRKEVILDETPIEELVIDIIEDEEAEIVEVVLETESSTATLADFFPELSDAIVTEDEDQ